MCWVSSEHLDGIWVSCTRWTIEVPIYFELSVDHLVAGSDRSPQRGDCQPYFSALCCQCWNHQFFFPFFFSLSSFSGIPYHRADDTLPKLFQNFFFFKRAREPRNKPRDLNLPISQNTWRSSNISPFSIIEQCANLSELPVQIPAFLPTSYVKRLPTSTIKIKIIYIYTLFHQRINK